MISVLVEALQLDVTWLHALAYVTDPEYLPLVINQVKYLYFLKSKDSDNRLIEFLFSESLTHCPTEEHRMLFNVTSEKMREKCEMLLRRNGAANTQGVEMRAQIDRVWEQEQNTVKTSLENTLTNCYTRFRSTLESQWETCKGYPATPGNDCYKEYKIDPQDCTIRLEREQPPFLTPPLPELCHQDITPDTSIPPYQIPSSERHLSNVISVVSKTVPNISDKIESSTSVQSSSKQNDEEKINKPSSPGNNLHEEEPTLTSSDKTISPEITPETINNQQKIEAFVTSYVEKVMSKYLPHLQMLSDGKRIELPQTSASEIRIEPSASIATDSVPEASHETTDNNTAVPPSDSLEESPPLTLNSVESSTAYNLNTLQNAMATEGVKHVVDNKQTDPVTEKVAEDFNAKVDVNITVKDSAQSNPTTSSPAVPALKRGRRKSARKAWSYLLNEEQIPVTVPNEKDNVTDVEGVKQIADEEQTDTSMIEEQAETEDHITKPESDIVVTAKDSTQSTAAIKSLAAVPPLKCKRKYTRRKSRTVPTKKKKKPVSPAQSDQTKEPASPVKKSTRSRGRPRKIKVSPPKPPVIRLKNTNIRRKMHDDLNNESCTSQACQSSSPIPITTIKDSDDDFVPVQIISEEAIASSTPITATIERTCEIKPKNIALRLNRRQTDSDFSAPNKKRKTKEKKDELNLVSEDDDDLYDPGDLSVDVENDSSVSLINFSNFNSQ